MLKVASMYLIPILTLLLTPASGAGCTALEADFLGQSVDEFDQSEAGWRSLAREGCYTDAGELIGTYRQAHGENLSPRQQRQLLWHEGQMFAYANRYEEAVSRFAGTYPETPQSPDEIYKIDAVIAFLERDRLALLNARNALAALPEPPEFRAAVERIQTQQPDIPPPTWPIGLETIENYIRCFEYSYSVAYEGLCEHPE